MEPSAAVVTVSDRGHVGEREDVSGPVIRDLLTGAGVRVKRLEIVPDERPAIESLLLELCGEGYSLVVTTGGTGISPRDVTPDATLAVVDMEVPGLAEAMRAESRSITPHAMISRAVCGLRGQTLIINLPGSPRGAAECLEVILPALPHAIEVACGRVRDCKNEQTG